MTIITHQNHMHYVCYGGCEGVSSEPGTCQDPNCPDHGKPLHACDCPDGMSHQFMEPDDADEETTI